jgi:NitT/TauT family transport system substrate-binding protein
MLPGRSAAVAIAMILSSIVAPPARAETAEMRIARQYGIGYLQMIVMEHDRLIERQAARLGVSGVKVAWSTFADGTVANDAMISGNLDFAAGGLGSFATLWDRTRGGIGVRGIAALDSMPMLLVTRKKGATSIRDLSEDDRIAIAGVKVSSQATTLQLAAAQTFGDAQWNRLDHLTVNMPHPAAVQALLAPRSGVSAHFSSPPFQHRELREPGMTTLLNSYDVWGGPQTFILAWTTSTFREKNPRLYEAFLAALREATDYIKRDPRGAAAIYREATGDRMPQGELAEILADPQLRFTLVPENVMKFVAFKVRIGSVRTMPVSWRDLFFPEIHHLPGS